ncbi:Phage-related lysozyme (plasmid) [Candidatus Trichorickettsia mobilis]|uniref:Lysozyme n=1 Tax=Candidatus Trichorickettsia mobilis TaxID=1346319 RepID=A0ABZ0UTV4_9RICK|nr:lysozyme [Candidatus Trichorickettsia mobilis]WPY01470.1 Phage-related lysozyme [Candidatus Trichorickettsia mobilis]
MNISQKGIDLIKKFEGFSPTPYHCPAGKMTIGYGHVVQASTERYNSPITEADAERMLLNDVKTAETTISKGVHVPLTQGQFDALVSLIYNWGGVGFLKSQGLKYLNSYDYRLAAEEFFSEEKGIVKVHGTVLPGLVRRRQAEWDLWNDK